MTRLKTASGHKDVIAKIKGLSRISAMGVSLQMNVPSELHYAESGGESDSENEEICVMLCKMCVL